MRYEFYGRKSPFYGKTLWEIVGNLKNFGVGRYIKVGSGPNIKEPCFLKILDVQCLPPSDRQFVERKVLVWAEQWYNGLKIQTDQTVSSSNIPKYQLIPKSEEHIYIEAVEKYSKNFVKKEQGKYLSWPPLFKILWERECKKLTKSKMEIPKLEKIIAPSAIDKVTLREDITEPPITCNIHNLDTPVEDLIQQVVSLKRKINLLKLRNSNQ